MIDIMPYDLVLHAPNLHTTGETISKCEGLNANANEHRHRGVSISEEKP